MKRVVLYTALMGLVTLTTGTVRAQTTEVSEERQMTLPEGRAFVQAFVELNLSDEAVLKPFSIAPDLWYGVSDQLTLGLVHSSRAATGFYGAVGDGLCLAGEENGCGDIYDSVGLDARFHFYREGDITAAVDGGLFVRAFDPFQVALKVGMVGRWQSGTLAVELAPSIFAGLTEREPEAGMGVVVGTNKEQFFLPITAIYGVSPQLGVALQTGPVIPFEEIGDTYFFQLSIGVQYLVSEKLFADLAFSFPLLFGGPDGTGIDARTLTLGLGYAL